MSAPAVTKHPSNQYWYNRNSYHPIKTRVESQSETESYPAAPIVKLQRPNDDWNGRDRGCQQQKHARNSFSTNKMRLIEDGGHRLGDIGNSLGMSVCYRMTGCRSTYLQILALMSPDPVAKRLPAGLGATEMTAKY